MAERAQGYINSMLAMGLIGRVFLRKETDHNNPRLLATFNSFMCAVRLWELDIKDTTPSYAQFPNTVASSGDAELTGYSDVIKYTWNESFDPNHIISAIRKLNSRTSKWISNLYMRLYWPDPEIPQVIARRLSVGGSLQQVLDPAEGDAVLPFWLPVGLADYANQVISDVRREHSGSSDFENTPALQLQRRSTGQAVVTGNFALYTWTIDSITMWQLLDRRLDEVFAILWSFYRATTINDKSTRPPDASVFIKEMSRRVIRGKEDDEFLAFAKWVAGDLESSPVVTHVPNADADAEV
jgi:hypothetical protein